jgi:aminoglycoside phosphotransferase (APT) family kinase protein
MTAAPEEHRTWKEVLFAGELEPNCNLEVACGQLLGQLHTASWANSQIAATLDDRSYFEQLRIDPYYRQVARVHADLAPAVQRLIDSVWQNRHSLVHGDFSPKNLLVWPGHMLLIDFEVGHFGDPAFDLGFFLTHLVLKSIWAGKRRSEYLKIAEGFWQTYRTTMLQSVATAEFQSLEQRMLWNLAGCMLARVDGKSPVDYLAPNQQSVVRELARRWIIDPPRTWADARGELSRQ